MKCATVHLVMQHSCNGALAAIQDSDYLNFKTYSQRLLAFFSGFLDTFATGGLTIVSWLMSIFDAIVQLLIFLNVLVILVGVTDKHSHTLLMRIAPMRLNGTTTEEILDSFSGPVRGVFVSSLKMVFFHGLYTYVAVKWLPSITFERVVADKTVSGRWLVFHIFELPLPVLATILSSLLSVVPLVPVILVFVPCVISVWLQVSTIPRHQAMAPSHLLFLTGRDRESHDNSGIWSLVMARYCCGGHLQ